MEEMRAKREFFGAKKRLEKQPYEDLKKAVRTLVRYREVPGLRDDILMLVANMGPGEEHPWTPF